MEERVKELEGQVAKLAKKNEKLEKIRRSYQKQIDENHEESIHNIKMLQEHFHNETQKVAGGKQKQIDSAETALKRKENEAAIWKAQAIKMENKFDALLARVKIVGGFVGVVFVAWLVYLFLVAPSLSRGDSGGGSVGGMSAGVSEREIVANNLRTMFSLNWSEKEAEALYKAYSQHDPISRVTPVIISVSSPEIPLMISLLSGTLTGRFLYPLPLTHRVVGTTTLGNHTLLLNPQDNNHTTEEVAASVFDFITQARGGPKPSGGGRHLLIFIRASDAARHQAALGRWFEEGHLEPFDKEGNSLGRVSLKNTSFFMYVDAGQTLDAEGQVRKLKARFGQQPGSKANKLRNPVEVVMLAA